MTMIAIIRKWLCRHDWRPSKFQALGAGTLHGYSYRCAKCGKMRHD